MQLPLFDAVEIPLSKGYVTLVDAIDADLASQKWFADVRKNLVYAGKTIKRHHLYLHRIVMERILGRDLPAGCHVDHANGNSLDNCRYNLRIATPSLNLFNSKVHSNNTSGYKGVYLVKSVNRWAAQIKINYQMLHLGNFDTPEAAYAAYCEAARSYAGEFARIGDL